MKNPALKFLTPAIAGACLGLCFSADRANAQTQYFTTVTNSGTYSWDAASWSTNGAPANAGPYASNWVPGNFARFDNGASDSYTVTVNQAESNTGIYNQLSSSTVTIVDAGGGTGSLAVSGNQGFLSSGTTVIDVPITGGGIDPELSGSIYLNAANTYTGGTALGDSGNTLVYFNNNSAFGTGGITLNRTGNFSTLLAYGGKTLTLANNFSTVAANTGATTDLNFASAANTPVIVNGTWSLGTVTLGLRNNGDKTAPLTLNGVISGSGGLIVSGANGGTIHLGAVNTYTGATTIGVTSDTAITLKLDVANAIAASSGVVLAGGTLDPGGNNQQFGTLGLTANSTIDFEAGAATMAFSDSSGQTWTAGDILDIVNFTAGDTISFSDATGLTQSQLNQIEINGQTGAWTLNSAGVLEVPEPSTIALGLIGGLGVFLMRRKIA